MKSYKYFENNDLTSDELLEKYNDIYNEAINCGDVDAANQAKIELDNITKKLDDNNIKSIEDVEYAFLETNGKLSIFKYNIFPNI